MAPVTPPIQTHPDRFLVCGLGSLGQHCVANLKAFGVRVAAIDRLASDAWEIEAPPELLDAARCPYNAARIRSNSSQAATSESGGDWSSLFSMQ